jgi:hypothetical protein
MIFDRGEQVVVKLNGTHRVGIITSRTRLKRGWTYSVKLENGKLVDSCSLNKELSDCYIIRGLTKSLNNENGQQEDI